MNGRCLGKLNHSQTQWEPHMKHESIEETTTTVINQLLPIERENLQKN